MKAHNKDRRGNRCGSNRIFGPFGAFADLEDVLTTVFGDERSADFTPRADVGETEIGYALSLELPGVSNENINVEIHDGRLEISGEKKVEKNEDTSWLRVERTTGAFKRVFEFSQPVDLEKISANLTDGVLTVLVPKSEKAMPRKIEINVD